MSNWAALRARLADERPRKRARGELSEAVKRQKIAEETQKHRKPDKATTAAAAAAAAPLPPADFVALDCEMVGVGSSGKRSALARCAIVGHDGSLLYDKHVRPNERITGAQHAALSRPFPARSRASLKHTDHRHMHMFMFMPCEPVQTTFNRGEANIVA